MECGANDPGGSFQSCELGGIHRTPLTRVIKANDADELTIEKDRYDRLALGAGTFKAAVLQARVLLINANTASRAQLRTMLGIQTHVQRSHNGVAQMRHHSCCNPLAG